MNKPVAGLAGYAADDRGFIIGKSGARMRGSVDGPSGYLSVTVYVDGARRKARVHVLMATTFCPREAHHTEIRHLDGNKSNNAASNLRWGTRTENISDRVGHGVSSAGERNGRAKLTTATVNEIRDAVANGAAQRTVARAYGVSKSTVGYIARGERWKEQADGIAQKAG